MNHPKRPFIRAGAIGLIMEVLLLVGIAFFPAKASHLPKGFFTPIIAFEFLETEQEVNAMFKSADGAVQKELVDIMDQTNQLDFIYMVFYSMFLMTFSITVAKQSGRKTFYFAAMLSVVVLLSDFLENLQLLGITAKINDGGFEAELVRLHLFTWFKWGGIILIFVTLFPWFVKGRIFSKTTGLIGLVSFFLGLAAFIHRSVLNELLALDVGLMFLLMVIYCFKEGPHEADSDHNRSCRADVRPTDPAPVRRTG